MVTPDAGYLVLTSPPIFDVLFAYCSPVMLMRLVRTCRGVCESLKNDYIPRNHDVNKLLARFFDDPRAFRALQARTNCVISGSQAVQLFSRVTYPKSDLDLYTYPTDGKAVCDWLQSVGYEYLPWNELDEQEFEDAYAAMLPLPEHRTEEERYEASHYRIPGIRGIFRFKKRNPRAGVSPLVSLLRDPDALEVQVIVADNSPVACIVKFHSTVVMNFITWNRAYSLYPWMSFEQRRALVTFSKERGFRAAMAKWEARGYKIMPSLSIADWDSDSSALGRRWVGDGYTWVLDLDTEGVFAPAPPFPDTPAFDHWTANGWELGRDPNTLFPDEFRCHTWFHNFFDPGLRFRYICPSDFSDAGRALIMKCRVEGKTICDPEFGILRTMFQTHPVRTSLYKA